MHSIQCTSLRVPVIMHHLGWLNAIAEDGISDTVDGTDADSMFVQPSQYHVLDRTANRGFNGGALMVDLMLGQKAAQ